MVVVGVFGLCSGNPGAPTIFVSTEDMNDVERDNIDKRIWRQLLV